MQRFLMMHSGQDTFLSLVHVAYLHTERITFESAPSPQEFNEGDDARIICDVVSSPPPAISWKHKGTRVLLAKDGEPKMFPTLDLLSHLQSGRPEKPSPCLPDSAVCQSMLSNQLATLSLALISVSSCPSFLNKTVHFHWGGLRPHR